MSIFNYNELSFQSQFRIKSRTGPGFLLIEFLIALLLVSFLTLLVSHYSVLIVMNVQEVKQRLRAISYATTVLEKFSHDPSWHNTYQGAEGDFAFNIVPRTMPYVQGMPSLLQKPLFMMVDLEVSWTGFNNQAHSICLLGGINHET